MGQGKDRKRWKYGGVAGRASRDERRNELEEQKEWQGLKVSQHHGKTYVKLFAARICPANPNRKTSDSKHNFRYLKSQRLGNIQPFSHANWDLMVFRSPRYEHYNAFEMRWTTKCATVLLWMIALPFKIPRASEQAGNTSSAYKGSPCPIC